PGAHPTQDGDKHEIARTSADAGAERISNISSPACYTNSGGVVVCLYMRQTSDNTYAFRVCKEGSAFGKNEAYAIFPFPFPSMHKPNITPHEYRMTARPGDECSQWRDLFIEKNRDNESPISIGVRAHICPQFTQCGDQISDLSGIITIVLKPHAK